MRTAMDLHLILQVLLLVSLKSMSAEGKKETKEDIGKRIVDALERISGLRDVVM
jgi:hypothetical protein